MFNTVPQCFAHSSNTSLKQYVFVFASWVFFFPFINSLANVSPINSPWYAKALLGGMFVRDTQTHSWQSVWPPNKAQNSALHTFTHRLSQHTHIHHAQDRTGEWEWIIFFVRSLQHNFVTCLVRCFFVRFFVFYYVRSRLFPRQNGATRARTLSSTFHPFTVPSPLPTAPPFRLQKRSTYLTVLLRWLQKFGFRICLKIL